MRIDETLDMERGVELLQHSVLPYDKDKDPAKCVLDFVYGADYDFEDVELHEEFAEQIHAAAAAQDGFASWLLTMQGIAYSWDYETLEIIEEYRIERDITGEIRSLRGLNKSDKQLAKEATEELDNSIQAIAGAIAIGNLRE